MYVFYADIFSLVGRGETFSLTWIVFRSTALDLKNCLLKGRVPLKEFLLDVTDCTHTFCLLYYAGSAIGVLLLKENILGSSNESQILVNGYLGC